MYKNMFKKNLYDSPENKEDSKENPVVYLDIKVGD